MSKTKEPLEFSNYQKKIFLNIGKETGHLIIEAYAGSAKTTSLIEGFKYIPKGKSAIALAFNKSIQKELQERSPSYIKVQTFHSAGLEAIKNRFQYPEIDDHKLFDIAKNIINDQYDHNLIASIIETVNFCKYGLLDTPNQIQDLMDRLSIDTCGLDDDKFIALVIKALALCKADTKKIDFGDMCWFPFVYNLNLGTYDYVAIDEFQDLNKSQLVMAKKMCRKDSGRMIFAGDSYQSLYSWRLADTSVIKSLKDNPSTKVLTLPISYRCPKKVIELVRPFVKEIQCPSSAKDGSIEDISLNQMYKIAKPGCFILSRVNAPLIKICLTFIRQGVKANIKGRDVGSNLTYLIKKSKKKQIPAFLKWLEQWKDKEVAKLRSKNISTENLLDKYECLVELCNDHESLKDVVDKIDVMFDDSDEKNIVYLSTVHKSKGLERDNVFLLKWTFRFWFDKIIDESEISPENEEANIAYVASTRAKNNLYLVHKNY